MMYQLTLQWTPSSTMNYETLLEIENLLTASLPRQSEVDGHDVGPAEMNIFILTKDPLLSFDEVRATLEGLVSWKDVRAAYREVSGDQYTVLWPKHLAEFRIT
jgi:hypothetical protein